MNSNFLSFDEKARFNVKAINFKSNSVNLLIESKYKTATCPKCARRSTTVHSFYSRKIKDLPAFGNAVFLNLRCKKFFCKNVNCDRVIFTERFHDQFKPYSRMSDRLVNKLLKTGLLTGGNVGARISRLHNINISASTILRLIYKAPLATPVTPKVLGIDDWAYKKGDRYGTALVDLEKRRIIELLPDRNSGTIKQWLIGHPGVEIITRDRYANYAKGATEGCPDATQVADRFHLLQNLTEALKKVLERNYKAYKRILDISTSIEHYDTNVTGVTTTILSNNATSGYNKRLIQMKEMKALHLKGESLRRIASTMKLSRATVTKYLRLEEPPTKISPKKFNFSEFTNNIQDIIRVNEGITTKSLINELRKMGYDGGQTTAYKFIKENFSVGQRKSTRCLNRHLYFPTKAALLLSKSPSKLSIIESEVVGRLCSAIPDIRQAYILSRQFRNLLMLKRGKLTTRFERWLKKVAKCGASEMRSFAKGMLSDFAAVQNAILLKWSNGQVEGQINKLKTVKRQMYGKCSFELLKRRLVMDCD